MIPIVTSCDESFLPGLKALYKSYLLNSTEGFEFWAILTGSDEFADHVRSLGINVILNPEFPSDQYPTSSYYPVAKPAMYTNLLQPDLFAEYEKSIHIDTDSLILQSLQPLVDKDMGERVLAATRCNGDLSTNYAPLRPQDKGKYGPMTSLMIFNHAAWKEKNVLPRFVETMQRRDIEWKMIGQGVLHYIIGNDWLMLPWNTQAHAGHQTFFTAPRKEIYTLHFMGTKPWQEFSNPSYITERKLKTRKFWQTYAG